MTYSRLSITLKPAYTYSGWFGIVSCGYLACLVTASSSVYTGLRFSRPVPHVLIMTLAWADMFACLLLLVRIAEQALHLTASQIPLLIKLMRSIETTAVGTSIMITAVIAADRYDCVCRPHRRFFSHRRGKLAAWASFLFSVVINIPAYVEIPSDFSIPSLQMIRLSFHVICFVTALVMIAVCYSCVYKAVKKRVKVGAVSTGRDDNGLRLNNEWSTRIPSAVSETIQLPFPIDTANQPTNQPNHVIPESIQEDVGGKYGSQQSSITVKDWQVGSGNNTSQQREPGSSMGRTQKANTAILQRKTTTMLFATSMLFLLTWLPYWIYIAVTFALSSGLSINPLFVKILQETYLILYINNAINPLIYGLANRRFRKDCSEVLRKIKLC